MDDYTGKSDFFMFMKKKETYRHLEWYGKRSQTEFNDQLRLQKIKLDRAEDSKGEDVKAFSHNYGIKLD